MRAEENLGPPNIREKEGTPFEWLPCGAPMNPDFRFPKQAGFREQRWTQGNEMIRSKGSLATVAFQLFFGARAARSFSGAPLMKTVCVHSSRSLRRPMYRRKL